MKNYVKPELFFESYELSQNIAACGWDMNQAEPSTCEAVPDADFNMPGIVAFVDGNADCNWKGEKWDYCYENSSDGNAVTKFFNS